MIKKLTQYTILLIVLFHTNIKLQAQALITEAITTLSVDFSNTMPTTVGSNPSTAFTGAGVGPNTTNSGRLNSNAWSVFASASNSVNFGGTFTTPLFAGVASASVSTGGLYAYTGSPYSVANPCMIIQASGSAFNANGYVTLKLQNNGLTNITSFDFSYDLRVRNDQGRSSFFNGQYSTNGTTFSDPPGGLLEYISPAASSGTSIVSVTSSAGAPFLVTINTVTIAPGGFLYLRWKTSDVGGAGSRDEFFLDNIYVKCYYQRTQLRTTYCGYTAESFGEFIGADSISVATDYKFTLNDGVNPPETFINSSGYPYLTLYTIPGMTYNKTYSVTVQYSADNGSTYSPPGATCTITSPATATTQIEALYCGYTPLTISEILRADLVSGATQYQFKIYNTALSYTQTLIKSNNNFNLTQFTGLVPSQTYSVQVRVNIFGAFNVYGPACDITVPDPVTNLSAGSCGSSPSSYNQILFADPLTGASQYEFRLINSALSYTQSVVKTNNNFSLSLFTGLTNSTTYTVNVSAFYNSSWSNFGTDCNVTTPILTTSLSSAYCGVTASSYTQYFIIDPLPTAATYKIRLYNTALSYTQTINKPNNNFNLLEFTGLAVGTSYSVVASGYVSGAYTPLGAVCDITTPASVYAPTTQLSSGSCNITPSLYSSILFADAVTGATDYEYQLTNTSLGYTQAFAKTNNNFNLSQFTGLLNGTTYTVQVRVKVGGVYGAYGPICTVTAPTIIPLTTLSVGSCNTTPALFSTILFADNIVGATQYEYKLNNIALGYSQSFVKSNNNFNLTQFTGLLTNTTYTVKVRSMVGGVFGAYGSGCDVTTPATLPTTQLSVGSCNSSPATFTTILFADGLSGATQYEFLITNSGLGYTQSFVKSNANFNLSQFSGLALSTTYSVQVRANTFGWGPYGASCDVLTPASALIMPGGSNSNTNTFYYKTVNTTSELLLDAMVYPNPFKDEFSINLLNYFVEEQITISIYDLTGKLIETKVCMPSHANELIFGSGYTAGLYNVNIIQGNNLRSIKVLKP